MCEHLTQCLAHEWAVSCSSIEDSKEKTFPAICRLRTDNAANSIVVTLCQDGAKRGKETELLLQVRWWNALFLKAWLPHSFVVQLTELPSLSWVAVFCSNSWNLRRTWILLHKDRHEGKMDYPSYNSQPPIPVTCPSQTLIAFFFHSTYFSMHLCLLLVFIMFMCLFCLFFSPEYKQHEGRDIICFVWHVSPAP